MPKYTFAGPIANYQFIYEGLNHRRSQPNKYPMSNDRGPIIIVIIILPGSENTIRPPDFGRSSLFKLLYFFADLAKKWLESDAVECSDLYV